ncbi:MAG: hypothetical protein RLZZ436_2924 [Planctomycetota bacterium]|jgi:plasmid maintenance system antidote protein VapI
MQRRHFLSGLLSLAAARGVFAAHTLTSAPAAPDNLTQHLQQLHDQLVDLAAQNNAAHPAVEALALTNETTLRLRRKLPVSPSLWQNLSDAILRTRQCVSISICPDITPLIAQQITQLAH